MRIPRRAAAFAVISCIYLGHAGRARGAGVLCVTVEADTMAADGMLDDWDGIRGLPVGGGSDAAVTVRCAHDDERLYLAFDVVDERILRAGAAPNRKTDDRLELSLRGGDGRAENVLAAYPGVDKVAPARTWRGGRLPASIQVEDSLAKRGWALELSVPLRELAGWGPHAPAVYYQLAYHDADLSSEGKVQTVLRAEGRLVFAAGAASFKAFLAEHHLHPADLTIDKLIDVDGEPGVERVLAGGKVIGIITDHFSYLELPVDRVSDVLAVRVIEATATGRPAFFAHVRQRGNGGVRELVCVWTLRGDGGFQRTVAVEVAKQLGERSLRSGWKLVARDGQKARGRGKRRVEAVPAGTDLVIEPGEVIGWDEDSYEETPAEDVTPILTPWGAEQRAAFSL